MAGTVKTNKWAVGLGIYAIALASILYPAYGPGSYIRQGFGTPTEVLIYATVSLVITALLFGTSLLVKPIWALIVGALGLLGALGGAEFMGVPVVLGGAATYFASTARGQESRERLVKAALIVGLLAIIATIAVVVFEPLTD